MDVREQVRRAAQQAEDAASLGWAALRALEAGPSEKASILDGVPRARLEAEVKRQEKVIIEQGDHIASLRAKLGYSREQVGLAEDRVKKLEQRLAERESRAPDISSVDRDKLLAEIARRLL